MKLAKILAAIGLAACLTGGGAQAKDWKTVRIGTDATYPPFESVEPSGAIVGWEVEYGNDLCAKMHVTCVWQNQDWDGIIPALLSGKFDMIVSSMNMTPARAQKVLFSNMYYATAPVWVGQASNKSDDTSPAFLKDKAIGTQSSTVFAAYLDHDYKGIEAKLYPGGDEPMIDLGSGRLDYAVTDILLAEKYIEKNPGCCRIIKEIPRTPDIFGPGVGAAFRPEDTDLKDMFNKAIAEADADGTFKRLDDKYFKINIRGK
jgi:polar amino acid transport system substrate-binding protein